MAWPCVNPFLWNKTVVIFVSQVRWCFYKAFVPILTHCTSSVVDCLRLKESIILGRIFVFSLLQSLLSFVFIHFHEILLLISQSPALLRFEFFHAFVDCPRSFEISTACLTEFLPVLFHLFPYGFPWPSFLHSLLFSHHQSWSDSCAIRWIHCHSCIIKLYPLLVESCFV